MSFAVLILTIFLRLLLRDGKISSVLKQAIITCRQETAPINLLQKHFKQISYYAVRNCHYTLIHLLINNPIKYYSTTSRGIFLEMQYGFYSYASLTDFLWLAIERAFTKNSRKSGTWLCRASLRKIIKAFWLVKYSSNFGFVDWRNWKGECPELRYALVFELTS